MGFPFESLLKSLLRLYSFVKVQFSPNSITIQSLNQIRESLSDDYRIFIDDCTICSIHSSSDSVHQLRKLITSHCDADE